MITQILLALEVISLLPKVVKAVKDTIKEVKSNGHVLEKGNVVPAVKNGLKNEATRKKDP